MPSSASDFSTSPLAVAWKFSTSPAFTGIFANDFNHSSLLLNIPQPFRSYDSIIPIFSRRASTHLFVTIGILGKFNAQSGGIWQGQDLTMCRPDGTKRLSARILQLFAKVMSLTDILMEIPHMFAVPLLLGNLIQQMYNLADSVVLGNFVGKEALAAVGSTTYICNTMVNFFNGVSIGAGVVISRRFGAHDPKGLHEAVEVWPLRSSRFRQCLGCCA